MLPELLVGYTVGLVPASSLCLAHHLRNRKRENSLPTTLLQNNLRKVNLYWSQYEGQIIPFSIESLQIEAERQKKAMLTIAIIFSVSSWPGFFFHLIVFASPPSRFEKTVFSSDLCKSEHSPANINLFLAEFKQLT